MKTKGNDVIFQSETGERIDTQEVLAVIEERFGEAVHEIYEAIMALINDTMGPLCELIKELVDEVAKAYIPKPKPPRAPKRINARKVYVMDARQLIKRTKISWGV